MIKITILGYHGFGNCGDEAILLAMINNIKKLNKDTEITVLSYDPTDTISHYNVNALDRFKFTDIIKAISNTDLLLAGGGTLLQDETSTRSLLYYLSIILFAKMLNKKVMLYSNGIGPVNGSFNKKLIKFVINKVDVITLRDDFSKTELVNIGVNKPPTYVTADPAFSLSPKDKDIDYIFEKEGIKTDKDLIGISIRKWKNSDDFVEKISVLSNYMLDKYDVNILLIPMQHSMDLEISRNLYNKINRENVYLLEGEYLSEEVLAIIGRLSVLISMRLHTLIFAGVCEVPLAGIVYDPKIENYLSLLDMPSLGDCKNLDVDFMKSVIDDIMLNRDEYLRKLNITSTKLKKDVIENDKHLLKLLEQIEDK